MPKTELPINFETPQESIFTICDAAGLKGKECNEVYHCLDAIRTWRGRFERLYGTLVRCVHNSNPDDPPDLTLNFTTADIEVEHTRLEPPILGWVEALHRRECSNQSITVPSITFWPDSRHHLMSVMLSPHGSWSDISADSQAWWHYILSVVCKKTENRPTGLLIIQNNNLVRPGEINPFAEAMHSLLTTNRDMIQDWTILIHTSRGTDQFISHLITANEELQTLNRRFDY